MNKSGIRPTGTSILVLPLEVEVISANGIVLATADKTKRDQMAQAEGQIIAIGAQCWLDQPDRLPWAKEDDIVLFAKFAGMIIQGKDGKEYRLVNDLDIKAVFE